MICAPSPTRSSVSAGPCNVTCHRNLNARWRRLEVSVPARAQPGSTGSLGMPSGPPRGPPRPPAPGRRGQSRSGQLETAPSRCSAARNWRTALSLAAPTRISVVPSDDYVREKLWQAVDCLATSAEPLQRRLVGAGLIGSVEAVPFPGRGRAPCVWRAHGLPHDDRGPREGIARGFDESDERRPGPRGCSADLLARHEIPVIVLMAIGLTARALREATQTTGSPTVVMYGRDESRTSASVLSAVERHRLKPRATESNPGNLGELPGPGRRRSWG